MDLSTLLFGAVLIVLPLIAAGLLAVMIFLERPAALSPATANAARMPTSRRQGRRSRRSGGHRA